LLKPLFVHLGSDYLLREPLDYLEAEGLTVGTCERSKWGIVERSAWDGDRPMTCVSSAPSGMCPLLMATMAQIQKRLRTDGPLGSEGPARLGHRRPALRHGRSTGRVRRSLQGGPGGLAVPERRAEAMYAVLAGFKLNTAEMPGASERADVIPHSNRFVVVDPDAEVRSTVGRGGHAGRARLGFGPAAMTCYAAASSGAAAPMIRPMFSGEKNSAMGTVPTIRGNLVVEGGKPEDKGAGLVRRLVRRKRRNRQQDGAGEPYGRFLAGTHKCRPFVSRISV
jgi:hypothetical protein